MKKLIIISTVAILIVLAISSYQYKVYKNEIAKQYKLTKEYENFIDSEIVGTSLITLINKSIDSNEKNNVKKDSKGEYIENTTNSIKIEIKFKELEESILMEKIEELGSEQFIKNFSTANFKCIQKEYHKKTGNIKYLLFEQI